MLTRFISLGFRITFGKNQPTKIHHVIDIEKVLGLDNLDEFINNTSF